MRLFSVLVLSLFLIGCDGQRTFEVEGRVAGFGDDPNTVIVEHTEVEGYMPAMTMPFSAMDPASIDELEQGDAISFTLHVTSDSSWIDGIATLPEDAIPASPAGDSMPEPPADAQQVLEPGDTLSNFTLISQREEEITREIFQERPYVITFIYTRCPLPDYCPLMSQHFVELQSQIQEQYGYGVGLLSVTVDPEYDTPQVLREYAVDYDASPDIWTMATGDPDEIEKVANELGVYYRPHAQSNDEVVHNLSTVVIDRGGTIHEIWRGSDWDPQDVMSSLAELN